MDISAEGRQPGLRFGATGVPVGTGPQTADTLGWILIRSGKAEAGLALLRQAFLEAPNDPRIQYHLAVGLRDTGSKDDAVKHLKAVTATRGEFEEKVESLKLLEELEK